MEYENLVADFAKRTRRNLETLRTLQREGTEVYEVTALMNSMLGLLVFPQQRFMEAIPETPLELLRVEGWPEPRLTGQFEQATNLRQLVRYLRNAVAHCNLRFVVDRDGQIAGVTLWNDRNGRKTWEAELSVKDLDGIVNRFLMLLESRGVMNRPDGGSGGDPTA